MNALPMLVVLAALVAVVLLWKVLVTAAGIGGAQWLLTSAVDAPAADVAAFGIPALLLALMLSRGLPRRPALTPTRKAVA
jgi:hypothetical protein